MPLGPMVRAEELRSTVVAIQARICVVAKDSIVAKGPHDLAYAICSSFALSRKIDDVQWTAGKNVGDVQLYGCAEAFGIGVT